MGTDQIILYSVSFILIASLALGLVKKTKEAEKLKAQLKKINGPTDEEFLTRGKFTELGLMSSGITHEISNPLTLIIGRVMKLSQMELTEKNKSEIEKGLDQIKSNAERIASIIKRMREYIYRNDEETEEFISLIEILNTVMFFFGQRLKNHGIELRLKNIENVYVSGHRGQFEQAILKLLRNSFDAIDKMEVKWIEISTKKTADTVRIYVRDSGPGIPAERRSTSSGFSIIEGIAQRHGGDFKYIDDEHTTFMLELPKASSKQYHH